MRKFSQAYFWIEPFKQFHRKCMFVVELTNCTVSSSQRTIVSQSCTSTTGIFSWQITHSWNVSFLVRFEAYAEGTSQFHEMYHVCRLFDAVEQHLYKKFSRIIFVCTVKETFQSNLSGLILKEPALWILAWNGHTVQNKRTLKHLSNLCKLLHPSTNLY